MKLVFDYKNSKLCFSHARLLINYLRKPRKLHITKITILERGSSVTSLKFNDYFALKIVDPLKQAGE